MSDPQNEEKTKIKLWLKAKNRTRDWLGEKVHVKKRTVNNWLSSAQLIPADKLTLIQRLMADDEEVESVERRKLFPTNQIFSLEVDLATYRAYSEAAKEKRQTLEEWSITELNEAAELYFGSQKPGAPKTPEREEDIALLADAEGEEAGKVARRAVRYPKGKGGDEK